MPNSPRCVRSRPNLLFIVTLCLDHLSSGEKRAGCADLVTCPRATFLSVYRRVPLSSSVYMRCILIVRRKLLRFGSTLGIFFF